MAIILRHLQRVLRQWRRQRQAQRWIVNATDLPY
jgi:hypothetical protein